MENDPKEPLGYRQPDLRKDPARPPRSFKFGPTRDGDDLAVRAIKWLLVIALVVWIAVEYLRDGK